MSSVMFWKLKLFTGPVVLRRKGLQRVFVSGCCSVWALAEQMKMLLSPQ